MSRPPGFVAAPRLICRAREHFTGKKAQRIAATHSPESTPAEEAGVKEMGG
jgi:hypothetical protein